MIEVVLDTETTGLKVKDGHRIVEIGCIELENQIKTSKKFHCYLNPERKVSEKAFEIHGYSDDFLKLQKKFKSIQLPINYKKKKSQFIIKNDFTPSSVKKSINNILKKII